MLVSMTSRATMPGTAKRVSYEAIAKEGNVR
jgi:hypothetical protein